MDPRNARIVGTAVGLVVFFVPLTALYWYMASESPAIRLHPAGAEAGDGIARRPGGEAVAPRPRMTAGRPADARGAPRVEPITAAAPVGVWLGVMSDTEVVVTLANLSPDRFLAVLPSGSGGVVRLVPADAGAGPPADGLYDPVGDTVVAIDRGGSYAFTLKLDAGVPLGTVKAVYDTRGSDLPEGVWRGRVESAPAQRR